MRGLILGLFRRPREALLALREAQAEGPVRGVRLRLFLFSIIPPLSRAGGRLVDRPASAGPPGMGLLGFVLVEALVAWIFIMAAAVGLGLAAWLLARPFGGRADGRTGLLLALCASVPGWLGGVFYLTPRLSLITAFFILYGLYVFYRGAEILIAPAGLRALAGYVGLVIGCYVVGVSLATGLLKLILALV